MPDLGIFGVRGVFRGHLRLLLGNLGTGISREYWEMAESRCPGIKFFWVLGFCVFGNCFIIFPNSWALLAQNFYFSKFLPNFFFWRRQIWLRFFSCGCSAQNFPPAFSTMGSFDQAISAEHFFLKQTFGQNFFFTRIFRNFLPSFFLPSIFGSKLIDHPEFLSRIFSLQDPLRIFFFSLKLAQDLFFFFFFFFFLHDKNVWPKTFFFQKFLPRFFSLQNSPRIFFFRAKNF